MRLKKFTYSIQHTDGLERNMKNFVNLNCKAMARNVPGRSCEGDYPFTNFDSDSLKS